MLLKLGLVDPLPLKRHLNQAVEKQTLCVQSKHGWHYTTCVWSRNNTISGPDTCECVAEHRRNMTKARELLTHIFEKQMNVTPGAVGATPHAPLMQTDVSVVSDAGLFTNTQIPTPLRVYNQTAIALDNPAGSGAPFDKKVSVYNIFQRWEDNNTTISPAMSSGSRVLTLSLDPQKLPAYIKDYVNFHESIIPAIDISISIAGAAGTIGWLAIGWVKDGSRANITLDDLQQVSMEMTNMNGTQVINTKLTDVRRTGLFRQTMNDPEPYPAIVMLIDHAVTNVQRNDGVNYPVRVQVKLAPECVLMEPFKRGGAAPSLQKFDLGSYFYDEEVDLLIGGSSISDVVSDTVIVGDKGFNTKDFFPVFTTQAMALAKVYDKPLIMCAIKDEDPDIKFLEQLAEMKTHPSAVQPDALPPTHIYIAFGEVQQLTPYDVKVIPTIGSQYSVNATFAFVGGIKYQVTQFVVQPRGCYMIGEASRTYYNDQGRSYVIFTGIESQTWLQENFNQSYHPIDGRTETVPVIWKNAGDDNKPAWENFIYASPTANNKGWLKKGDSWLKDSIKTFLQTGNSMPSTPLPTGVKLLTFLRPGTSTKLTSDIPFVPIEKPLLPKAMKALRELIAEVGFKAVKATLVINGENKGEVGFLDGQFIVRSDSFKRLLPRVGDDVKLTNISELPYPQALAAFNTTGFQSWAATKVVTRARVDFSIFEQQAAAFAAAMAGNAISGIGAGITEWSRQKHQKAMMEQMNNANAALQGANNAAIARRQKEMFERNLQLTGYSSSSAQFGLIGPRTENHMNTQPYRNLEQSFIKGEILNPMTSTQGNVEFDKKGKEVIDVSKEELPPAIHDVTNFTDNPAYVPTPRNTFIENQAPDDVDPIDPALDKEMASYPKSSIVHAKQPTQLMAETQL